MTGTELLTDLVAERTRLLAENERLRERVTELVARVTELEAFIAGMPTGDGSDAIIDDLAAGGKRLHARVLELEAEIATIRGTLSRPDEPDDQPAIIHHDVPPNAPR